MLIFIYRILHFQSFFLFIIISQHSDIIINPSHIISYHSYYSINTIYETQHIQYHIFININNIFVCYSYDAHRSTIIKYFNQSILQQQLAMQTFRKKYIYNPDNPIYTSQNVRTYNCMNTQTKDKKLILIQHLKQAPFVQPSTGVLQPIEIPTTIQPFSVYPIVRCVSQIGKLAEPQVMYVIKCILESKVKKPLYCTVSNQGICCSEVQGILPDKSPEIFQLAIDMLDIPANLQEVQKSVVSKQGYSICRALKNGQNPINSINNYGWKDIKKQKQFVYDDQFVILKGRRKQQGPFGQQYGLAWSNQHGMCKFKYISTIRDGYEQQFYQDFQNTITYIQNFQQIDNKQLFLKIYKCQKDSAKGIKIFTQLANQGNLSQYISKKNELSQTLKQKNCATILDIFIQNMARLSNQLKSRGLGYLHIKSLYVHNNRICIGQPQLITDKSEKKLRQLKNSMDYYAPEMKQNIILPQNLFKLDKQKMDIWSFGFVLHKMFVRQIPIFDASKKPVLSKQKLSLGMIQLILQCLDINPTNRPVWSKINIKQISQRSVVIQQVKQEKPQRQEIRLGSRSQRRDELKSPSKKQRKNQQRISQKLQQIKKQAEQQHIKLKPLQQEEQIPYVSPLPTQISSRLKKIKLIVKIIAVMLLYIFVFFRIFLGNTITLMTYRNYYTTATLQLVDYNNTQLSTVTVITNDPIFFLKNDISFTEIQQKYQCINDKFDPIYNPSYSLLTYVLSGSFVGLIIAGWATALLICVIKAISIWKGGISNRPQKKQFKYWLVYGFHQLTLAALLFAHFFIFEFFYFSGANPCLSINTFTGLQPFFDSSLFLFLQNTTGYFQQIFSTFGVLSIILVLSTCFYAWGPKLDQKYFISVPSILLRIIPLILLLLICRIGVFMLFSPTAINDTTQILPAIMKGSFQGFIGIVPQIFILIVISVQVLIELLMYWCERKASQSDQLAKLFNIKNKKLQASQSRDFSSINDMSIINNSKQRLDSPDIQQM